ncbi:MAG: SMI1/KNR4 family protein [Culicoidibacterales bacterium]
MFTFENLIQENSNCFTIGTVSTTDIKQAETALGLEFSQSYSKYLERFGALAYENHEIYGLGVEGYLNVINSTKELRAVFPKLQSYIVIENLGYQYGYIVLNQNGEVFATDGENFEVVATDFETYLLEILQ